MNETITSILTRRSVRKFKEEQISCRQLETLLECAVYAPSAMGLQPWHFTAILNGDTIDEMVEGARSVMRAAGGDMAARADDPSFHNFYHAPAVIVISGAPGAYSQVDCAMAAQNIALAAQSMGLATCIIGSCNIFLHEPQAAEYLEKIGVPQGYTPVISLAIGYADEQPGERAPRRDGLCNVVE